MTEKACDYRLSDADADALAGVALLPVDMRTEILTRYLAASGSIALVNLFAKFIGLANSVVQNNRGMIEVILIGEGDMHPYQAEKANLPTIFGALQGVKLANSVQPKAACQGCAYRLGTMANQSPATTGDAAWCASDSYGEDFMCHERLDEAGQPRRVCIGHAQRLKGKAA